MPIHRKTDHQPPGLEALSAYYRCPERFVDFSLAGELSSEAGYFRFGDDTICYGTSSAGFRVKQPTDILYDVFQDVTVDLPSSLPFDPTEIIDNLRKERYIRNANGDAKKVTEHFIVRQMYHLLRPLLPVPIRRQLQRIHLRGWDKIPFPSWPVDRTVDVILEKLLAIALKSQSVAKIPFIWFWPREFQSCVIMTHDVEQVSGRNFCSNLMDIDDKLGIKSSFQIVPEKRYAVTQEFLNNLRQRGFEINVQDLNHDGHLFANRQQFLLRAERINRYGKEYGAVGFRSAILYRNQEWYDALDFSYDMSVPAVGHLEAQHGGCCTVMPYFIGNILELPVTTTQDYTLFHILKTYTIDLWKSQLSLIAEKHGLTSFIVHPDYIIEKRPRETYIALLKYLSEVRSRERIWIAHPREVNDWWRQRSQMKLVNEQGKWRIEGEGKERAMIAYATMCGDRLTYTLGRT